MIPLLMLFIPFLMVDETAAGGAAPFKDLNDKDLISLMRRVVIEQNKKNNTKIKFVKVLEMTSQIVSGTIWEGKIKTSGGIYQVRVWGKLLNNEFEIEEFKKIKA